MANSVGPDQTSSLIWIYAVCQGLSVQKLRIIMVSDGYLPKFPPQALWYSGLSPRWSGTFRSQPASTNFLIKVITCPISSLKYWETVINNNWRLLEWFSCNFAFVSAIWHYIMIFIIYRGYLLFWGENHTYFIECVENISTFTSA